MRIAYKANNTINKRLAPKPHNPSPKISMKKSGVYRLI